MPGFRRCSRGGGSASACCSSAAELSPRTHRPRTAARVNAGGRRPSDWRSAATRCTYLGAERALVAKLRNRGAVRRNARVDSRVSRDTGSESTRFESWRGTCKPRHDFGRGGFGVFRGNGQGLNVRSSASRSTTTAERLVRRPPSTGNAWLLVGWAIFLRGATISTRGFRCCARPTNSRCLSYPRAGRRLPIPTEFVRPVSAGRRSVHRIAGAAPTHVRPGKARARHSRVLLLGADRIGQTRQQASFEGGIGR
jgi:hypothetical protein